MRVEPKDLDRRMPKNHHALTIVLGIEVDDPGLHHHDTTIAQSMGEEVDDPKIHDIYTTMRTMKLRWGRHDLLEGFTERRYPKDSNYPMISKSMTDRKSHNHGYQIICR
jgi:hypothetical protein